jgi:hypothetical protein
MKINTQQEKEIKEVLGFQTLEDFNDAEKYGMWHDVQVLLGKDFEENDERISYNYNKNVVDENDYENGKRYFEDSLRQMINLSNSKNKTKFNPTSIPESILDKTYKFVVSKIQSSLSRVNPSDDSDIFVLLKDLRFNNVILNFYVIKENYQDFVEYLQHFNFRIKEIRKSSGLMLCRGTVNGIPEQFEEVTLENIMEVANKAKEDIIEEPITLEEEPKLVEPKHNKRKVIEPKVTVEEDKIIEEETKIEEEPKPFENNFGEITGKTLTNNSAMMNIHLDIDLLNPDLEAIERTVNVLLNLHKTFKK